jgi:alpha-galactosidase
MPGNLNPPAFAVDSLVQVKFVGDPYPGAFAQGHTMHNSPSVDDFQLESQERERTGDKEAILTRLRNSNGITLEHRLSWHDGDAAVEINTSIFNGSPTPVMLEMLSSFSVGGITPFDGADAAGRLRVHRFRGVWSAEGRLETRSIEELHLERSWSGAGMFSERFGQVGTMPVRKWFPFVAIEDIEAGVVWAAQLAWSGSWQMEIFRQNDDVSISGGLADREFGHWMKKLAPGESLAAPTAVITCVQGNLDDATDRLVALHHRAADTHPAVERDLPIVFNDWCTSWGDPQHDKIVAIARRLKHSDTLYHVIDAGWYKQGAAGWEDGHGDWLPSARLFPHGLKATAAAIREQGLIPGLWFEIETVGKSSAAFSLIDHLLRRDGMPVTARSRRFWDMNDPWTLDYLRNRVISVLEECGFGYLKVDYNETLGIGCEHPDSLGEGLRRQVEGIHRFFEEIRARLPELVIENCASGGHRLEPAMLARSAMSSFSDAHELPEIPIIAANLHRLMLPRQSQVWAVLHRADSEARLVYSLAATFLGRMCLSGEIAELTDEQWQLVLGAQRFYKAAAPIIKYGRSRRTGAIGESWRHPRGWQAVRRIADDERHGLVVFHAFEEAPPEVETSFPGDGWKIDAEFPGPAARLDASNLRWTPGGDFTAHAVLLARK